MNNLKRIIVLFLLAYQNILAIEPSEPPKGSKEEFNLMRQLDAAKPGTHKFASYKLIVDQILSSPASKFIKDLVQISSQSIAELTGHNGWVNSVAWSPDGSAFRF